MRTITGNITNLTNNYQSQEIEFTFCDKYSNETILSENSEIIKSKIAITDEEGNFEIELFETLKYKDNYHYTMNIDDLNIKIFIPVGMSSIDLFKLFEPLDNLDQFYEYLNI